MGGSSSKNSIFDEDPKDYKDIIQNKDSAFYVKDWRVGVDWYSTYFYIGARKPLPNYRTYEVVYQIIIANKHHLRKRIVNRGIKKLNNAQYFYSERIYSARLKPTYNQFNFQAVVYAFIEDNGLRKLNFEDENVYGESITVLTSGGRLEVPIEFLTLRAPFLAKYMDKKKPSSELNSWLEEFFQEFHGVHVQLEKGKVKSLLKFAAKYQVLNVKKYCEQQLIRREDLEVSEKRKFKLACKYNLNILMSQVLRNVKTVEEIAKLASIAIETVSMDTNISKLLIAKMKIYPENCYKCFLINVGRPYPDKRKYEFCYRLIIKNKYHLRSKLIFRGVKELEDYDFFYGEQIDDVFYKPNYNQFNFQAVVYAFIEDNGLRKLNFEDENVYGKSMIVFTDENKLFVPIKFFNIGAPLLTKYINKKKKIPILNSCLEEFFQVFHGVHVQLEIEKLKPLLKLSSKFELLSVKRYCEQQLIRREDLVSEKRKFKMACKFNLNILINQLLKEVKTVKKLVKLASIAIEIESMDTNISKLLVAKMYKIS